MTPPRLIARRGLDNGLTLEFWDYSRLLGGDRWFVNLEGRIAIPVRAETLPAKLQAQAVLVVEALGEEIVFSQQEVRNFIAASEAPGLLQVMQDQLLALAPGYFGRTDFAARLIRKKFAELVALRRWRRLDTRGDDA
jgi:hypothetical protein